MNEFLDGLLHLSRVVRDPGVHDATDRQRVLRPPLDNLKHTIETSRRQVTSDPLPAATHQRAPPPPALPEPRRQRDQVPAERRATRARLGHAATATSSGSPSRTTASGSIPRSPTRSSTSSAGTTRATSTRAAASGSRSASGSSSSAAAGSGSTRSRTRGRRSTSRCRRGSPGARPSGARAYPSASEDRTLGRGRRAQPAPRPFEGRAPVASLRDAQARACVSASRPTPALQAHCHARAPVF